MSRVSDGASLRRTRILELMQMINLANGATMQEIQGHMWARFGLKFETTRKYVMEAHLAGFLRENHGKWYVTDRYTRLKPLKGRHDL